MELGLSQQAVADRVGVSKVTVSDLERGNMALTVDYMRRLAHALDVTPADLLAHSDNPAALTHGERAIIDRLRAADDSTRDQAHRVFEAMLPWKGDESKVA